MFGILKKKATDMTVGETLGLSLVFTALALVPAVIPIAVESAKEIKERKQVLRDEEDEDEDDF